MVRIGLLTVNISPGNYLKNSSYNNDILDFG